ncbi:MAG TPA: di-heme oxidoredictase family protein [Thermoanaerobaculia bacterium]|nr:di-heme oxidoredictase family protein [Thermoanaerobaculia bacterium]
MERHRGEAAAEQRRFKALSPADRQALLEFLRSL